MPLHEVFRELVEYVGFTREHAHRMAEMAPLVRDGLPEIVERFYAAIQRNPGAASVFENEQQVDRLKASLRDWLERFFSGEYGEDYVEARARIGMVHVAIRLDQRYMFGAMNVIRDGIHGTFLRAAADAGWSTERMFAGLQAVDKLCDLELAIMLENYSVAAAERLRANERLAAIGQLAGSVAHELRNPLAAIETSRTLISRKSPDEHTRKHTDRIGAQVRFATDVIHGLLGLTRDEPPARRPVRLDELLRDALESVRPRPGVRVTTDIDGDLPRVSVDPVQMRQVIFNLVTNATQAIAAKGEQGEVRVHAAVQGGDLVLTVEDDGPGLAPEVRAHLFEPLFTTRLKGVGLGLALCRRIIERHGGRLEGNDGEGGGAVFQVTLPGAAST